MHVPGFAADIGAWCNGNTWVSKTFVVSSNLTAPARNAFPERERRFFKIFGGVINMRRYNSPGWIYLLMFVIIAFFPPAAIIILLIALFKD